MYWWNTRKLAEEIKEDKLTERQKKNYYLWTGIITLVSVYIITASPASAPIATLIQAVAAICISIFGINLVFRTNQGATGHDFVGRVVALSFPILIKILVISIVYGVLFGIAMALSNSKQLETWSIPALDIIVQLFYFWRLNVHLKTINT